MGMFERAHDEEEQAAKALASLVVTGANAGKDRASIAAELTESGLDAPASRALVDDVLDAAARERFDPSALLPAIFGGMLAAIGGGVVWGLIVALTDYELGFVAWGIGFAAAFTVGLLTRGKRGAPLQVVAVVASILGIVVGKYIGFVHFFKQYVGDQFGAEAAAHITHLSGDVLSIFAESVFDLLSPFDLLWVGLAVTTAWVALRGSGLKEGAGSF